ncbi:hypothetical protein M426DRAFT_83209 [Hypoxylon sp. CI-4A]|nr:hypothetical protein M426DRAFT_83209 [Hypoxylon sp. CI-4A]
MRQIRAGCVALCLSLAGQAAVATPTIARRATCTELSTTTPNWVLTEAFSSDWPGGGGGYIAFFARHSPTGILTNCDIEYRLNGTDGSVIDYDPATIIQCTNFDRGTLNTTAQLDLDTLLLNLRGTWSCEGDDATTYEAAGETTLLPVTSGCTVEPTQIGNATTCPMSDGEVEGKLVESS